MFALMWLLAGCAADPVAGYSSESVYSEDIQTVSVPIFANDSFARGLEFDLTDAIVKEIESRTPYLVTSSATADSVLTGRISAVELDQLSKSRQTGLNEEVIYSVTIDFRWENLRTGRPIVERRQFTSNALFVPSQPAGEPIELARFDVVEQLAADIVHQMQAEW